MIMRFDLVDLQLFIAVAETRSITNGAQRHHLALASASARIKGLEQALGVVLLVRGRRGVELTPAGESLLDHARIVILNVEALRGDLLAFSRGVKATVRFLANTSGLSEYLPKTLAAFLGRHRRCCDAGGRGEALRARDEDQRRQDQGSLGQPAARNLRPQLQVAAAAGETARRPSAHGRAVKLTSLFRGARPL